MLCPCGLKGFYPWSVPVKKNVNHKLHYHCRQHHHYIFLNTILRIHWQARWAERRPSQKKPFSCQVLCLFKNFTVRTAGRIFAVTAVTYTILKSDSKYEFCVKLHTAFEVLYGRNNSKNKQTDTFLAFCYFEDKFFWCMYVADGIDLIKYQSDILAQFGLHSSRPAWLIYLQWKQPILQEYLN